MLRRLLLREACRAALLACGQPAGLPAAARAGAVALLQSASCSPGPLAAAGSPLAPRSPGRAAAGYSSAPAGAAQAQSGLQQFRLAQTGEGIKECELVQWFVREGDAVEEFGRICEVQSDKATVEITSPFAGTIRALRHQPGDTVQVGEVLADIHVAGTPADAPDEHLGAPAADAPPLPPPPPPPASSEAGAGTGVNGEAGAGGEYAPPGGKVLTSPAVRRLAQEHGLDLSLVRPTGPEGRVTKGDILAYLESLGAAPTSTVSEEVAEAVPTTAEQDLQREVPVRHAHVAQPRHLSGHGPGGAVAPGAPGVPPPSPALGAAAAAVGLELAAPEPTLVPLRGYRKAMVKSMEAAARIPHFHYCDEVNVGALVSLREELRGDPALGGAKLTFLPFFMKAAALALREFPLLNASLAPDGSAVIQHNTVNLGVAMATSYGLVVPNIKGVQWKSIAQIAQELQQLQRAAADNKLRQEDVRGGTFTLSNIGTIGGIYATPLVNPPEVGIMALGKIQRLPRFAADGCTVEAAEVMSVSLGADHRVVDGATLAGFAKAWSHFVERPGALLLHLQ